MQEELPVHFSSVPPPPLHPHCGPGKRTSECRRVGARWRRRRAAPASFRRSSLVLSSSESSWVRCLGGHRRVFREREPVCRIASENTRRQASCKGFRCYGYHSPTHPPPSLTPSLTHSLTHSFTHSLTHSLTHSPTHPLTHSPTHSLFPLWVPALFLREPYRVRVITLSRSGSGRTRSYIPPPHTHTTKQGTDNPDNTQDPRRHPRRS